MRKLSSSEAAEWTGDLRYLQLWAVLAETGMRLGEAPSLQHRDWSTGRSSTATVSIVERPHPPAEPAKFNTGTANSSAADGTIAQVCRVVGGLRRWTTLIAGSCAGADSIDDLDIVRSGGMKTLFGDVYAPSTIGTLLREFTFGYARQPQ
ncbi:hypothetical protein ACNUDN_02027 [Mycobacterium sp. smrl_JER01]